MVFKTPNSKFVRERIGARGDGSRVTQESPCHDMVQSGMAEKSTWVRRCFLQQNR